MKLQRVFMVILLSLIFVGGVQAAGSPMNEDFSGLVALSEKALATGKSGNSAAFVVDAEAAFKLAKEQSTTANSPAMQRISSKLRAAMNAAKDGKIAEGTALIEEALVDMKKGTAPAKFGGGS
jgi:hypothetical protein